MKYTRNPLLNKIFHLLKEEWGNAYTCMLQWCKLKFTTNEASADLRCNLNYLILWMSKKIRPSGFLSRTYRLVCIRLKKKYVPVIIGSNIYNHEYMAYISFTVRPTVINNRLMHISRFHWCYRYNLCLFTN